MKDEPRDIDWERIETQYRVGTMSLREIGAAHGITEGAIRKRAKRDGWARDLSAKVRAQADALVRAGQVRAEVREESPTEQLTVEVEAQVQARIRLAHRADIARARRLVMKLLAELEEQTENPQAIARLGELVSEQGDLDLQAMHNQFRKVASLGGRAANLRALADALKTLIMLERQAFGLEDSPATSEPTLAQRLRELDEKPVPPHAPLPSGIDLR